MKTTEVTVSEKNFLQEVKTIIESGRQAAYGAVNAAMSQTYWKIGRRIVEEEQIWRFGTRECRISHGRICVF